MLLSNKKLKLLIDADMFVFRACAAVERPIDWDCGITTLHCEHTEAEALVDDMVIGIVDKVLDHYKHEGKYEIIMCFSDANNFRKTILPTYKMNRAGKRKPLGYQIVVDWVKENFTCYQKNGLEADDCIGILATLNPDSSVIISGDKDFKSIPGRFYNFLNDTYYTISEQEADYNHLYQTLIGDAADNYKGCPGIGAVTAKKILDASPTWEACLAQFVKKNLTEEEALTQARVARILRKQDYDFTYKCPILWTPK